MQLSIKSIATAAANLWTRWGGSSFYGGASLRVMAAGEKFDYLRAAGDTWSNSILAICIRWVGDNFPKPIMRVSRIGRKGEYRPIPSHAMVDLWQRPNQYYTGRTLSKAVGLSLMVDGNAYLVKVRSGSGAVVELWWIPHWLIFPCWPADGSQFISHYEIRIDGIPREISKEDVIHFRDGLDPRNERLGLAAVKAQLREICTLNEASSYSASLLRNGAVPGIMLIPDSEDGMLPTEASKLKGQVQDQTQGEHRGSVIALTARMKVVVLGFTPEQLRLDQLPLPAEARVCAAVGLSPMVVGLPDPGKTYANLSEARNSAWQNCLVPLQDLIAETLRWQLLNEFEDPKVTLVEFDYSHVEALQENQKLKSDRIRGEWKDGLITQNEARDQLGYQPDADGDRFYPLTMPAQGPAGPVEPADEAEPPAEGDRPKQLGLDHREAA